MSKIKTYEIKDTILRCLTTKHLNEALQANGYDADLTFTKFVSYNSNTEALYKAKSGDGEYFKLYVTRDGETIKAGY